MKLERKHALTLLAVAAWNVVTYARFTKALVDTQEDWPTAYYVAHSVLIVVNLVIAVVLVPCVRSSCALRALIARTSLRCQISLDEPVWRRSGALRCTHAEHANRSIASHAGH